MKKVLFFALLVFFSAFQSLPVQADLLLSPSGLSVIDQAGNYWYRDIGGTYFGSSHSTLPGSLVYNLNDTSYDGRNNWAFASQAQLQSLVSQLRAQIPATPANEYDSGSPFVPTTWELGGGHWNYDWSIGPEWEGTTDISISPGTHEVYQLGFYKVQGQPGQPDFYEYRESYYTAIDFSSGPFGSWLIATASAPPTQTPEPLTMILLGFGLAGLAGVRRKFRK